MEQIDVYLSGPQLLKAKKQLAIQLSVKSYSTQENVTIKVEKKISNRMVKAFKNGKGVRLPEGSYEIVGLHAGEQAKGGSLKSIGKAIKKAFRSKTGQAIGKLVLDQGVNYARSSGYVDDSQASALRNVGTKLLREDTKGALRETTRAGLEQAMRYQEPSDKSGGKLVKGSPEMKAKMARLREMRSAKSGGKIKIGGQNLKAFGRDFGRGMVKGLAGTAKAFVQPDVLLPLAMGDYGTSGVNFTKHAVKNVVASTKGGSIHANRIRVVPDSVSISGSGFMPSTTGADQEYRIDQRQVSGKGIYAVKGKGFRSY